MSLHKRILETEAILKAELSALNVEAEQHRQREAAARAELDRRIAIWQAAQTALSQAERDQQRLDREFSEFLASIVQRRT